MPNLIATAPGKLILLGEHAVVYGQPAIAVPLSQVQAQANIQAAPRAVPGSLRLLAPAIGLDADLAELPPDQPLALALRLTLQACGLEQAPACKIRLTSSIPLAAGLGSGAAASVALIRALAAFVGRPLPDEQVCELAYQVEKLHHGTPSGVDNTVITYNRPVYFVRGQPLETFHAGQPLTLVVGDTGVSSPTAAAVGDVRAAWQADSARFEGYFAAIGALVQSARQVIESGGGEALGPLLDANHDLLVKLGVSSPELERLVQIARLAGAWGAKLSGGGRGGNMLALAPPEKAETIARALQNAGAVRTLTTQVG